MDKQPVVMSEFDKFMEEERQITMKGIEQLFKESSERVSKSLNSLEKKLDKLGADGNELGLRVDESLETIRDLQKRVEMSQNDIRILWNSHDEVYFF